MQGGRVKVRVTNWGSGLSSDFSDRFFGYKSEINVPYTNQKYTSNDKSENERPMTCMHFPLTFAPPQKEASRVKTLLIPKVVKHTIRSVYGAG